jgi:hypothetical protein
MDRTPHAPENVGRGFRELTAEAGELEVMQIRDHANYHIELGASCVARSQDNTRAGIWLRSLAGVRRSRLQELIFE